MSTETFEADLDFDDSMQSEADKRLLVKFYTEAVHQEFASIEAGRPIYKDEHFISIRAPGTRNEVTAPASYDYQQRFPRQWAMFKRGMEQTMTGTPLAMLPWMSKSQVAELNAANCHTVEQLATMPDSASQVFMGHHSMKQRAQAFLDSAKEAAPAIKLQAELEKRDQQIAELQATVEAMLAAKKAEDSAKKVGGKT